MNRGRYCYVLLQFCYWYCRLASAHMHIIDLVYRLSRRGIRVYDCGLILYYSVRSDRGGRAVGNGGLSLSLTATYHVNMPRGLDPVPRGGSSAGAANLLRTRFQILIAPNGAFVVVPTSVRG